MKYGVLFNKNNINIGDDIQAYATARFLPSVDYFIDREHIDQFITDDKKACAVLMNAWYMWAKWNWPPSKYIYPHFIGFHYADHQLANQKVGTPVKYEFLEGIGGEYMKAYGPVGCRDMFTMDRLKGLGINSYFTGCITLTLPKQPETPDKNSYICLVDIDEKVKAKIKEQLKDTDIEIREICHNRERQPDMPWEDRLKIVTDMLTVYQNARCVVTKRLHCALPCLAMEVPVFLVKGMEDDIRFDPYYDFLHRTTPERFLNGNYEYDFLNPPANKKLYKPVREDLIKSCQDFVEKTKDMDDDPDKLNKTTYSQEDVVKWRHDTMKKMMDVWLFDRRELVESSNARQRRIKELREKLEINRADKLKFKEKAEIRLERIENLKAGKEKAVENNKKLKERNESLREDKIRLLEEVKELRKKSKQLEKQLETELNRSLLGVIKRKIKTKFGK